MAENTKYLLTDAKVISQFKEIYNNKYDYSIVDYTNLYKKIICPIHGVFEQIAMGHGCNKCSVEGAKPNQTLDEDLIKSAIMEKKFFDKNKEHRFFLDEGIKFHGRTECYALEVINE